MFNLYLSCQIWYLIEHRIALLAQENDCDGGVLFIFYSGDDDFKCQIGLLSRTAGIWAPSCLFIQKPVSHDHAKGNFLLHIIVFILHLHRILLGNSSTETKAQSQLTPLHTVAVAVQYKVQLSTCCPLLMV